MRSKYIIIVFSIALVFIGCGGSSGSSVEPKGDGIVLISDGKAVDDIRRLDFGESFSFKVQYNTGEDVDDFTCSVHDSDGVLIESGAGTVVCESGEGTYTAPRDVPGEGSYVQLHVSIELFKVIKKDTSGALTATLDIMLPCEYTSNCVNSDFPLCYFEQCIAYEDAGIDTDVDACLTGDACADDQVCIGLDKTSCDTSFYCVDFDEVLITEASCTNGIWIDDPGACLTADMLYCGSNTDISCNANEVESCFVLSDNESSCISSYIISDWNDLPYNCAWKEEWKEGDEGFQCYVLGYSDDPDDACVME